jgi:chaperonin GroEL (HSP60 family)
MLGSCDKVTITKDNTTIVSGHGDPQLIKDRGSDQERAGEHHQQL